MFAGSFAIKLFVLCSGVNPQPQLGRSSITKPQKLHLELGQRGKNTNKVLEKPSLFAFFVKYHQSQQQGSALLLLSNSSGSAFSLGAGSSGTSPTPRRVPEPPASRHTANALGWDPHPSTHPQNQQHKDTTGWSSNSLCDRAGMLGTGPNSPPTPDHSRAILSQHS